MTVNDDASASDVADEEAAAEPPPGADDGTAPWTLGAIPKQR